MVKEIPLQNGMVALVDAEDWDRCMEYVWLESNTSVVYTKIKLKSITLGRFILHVDEKESVVSHENKNQYDFRKLNLIVSDRRSITITGKGHKNSTSKYKGVSWHEKSKKWMARVNINGKRMYLGCYENEEEAAEVYNKAVLNHLGEHAYINEIGVDNNSSEKDVKAISNLPRIKNRTNNYRGVYRNRFKYNAKIGFNRTYISLGSFDTPEEAAKAYDKKAKELHGDKAILNFPQHC